MTDGLYPRDGDCAKGGGVAGGKLQVVRVTEPILDHDILALASRSSPSDDLHTCHLRLDPCNLQLLALAQSQVSCYTCGASSIHYSSSLPAPFNPLTVIR